MNIADFVTALGGLAGLAALIVAFSERRKKHADYANQISEAALQLINPLRERLAASEARIMELEREVAELRLENERLRRENGDLKAWAERLVHQVQSLGAMPVTLRISA